MRIIQNIQIAKEVFRMDVEASAIAQKRQAGQFVVLRVSDRGERIPLTIADADAADGTITLIYQVVGKSTHQMSVMRADDRLHDLLGPLGKPTAIPTDAFVVCVGGGIGAAPLFPIAQACRAKHNRVVTILGFRSRDRAIMMDELKKVSDELIVVTDDGSLGQKALVTTPLAEIYVRAPASSPKPDEVIAIGPPIMMQKVSELTQPHGTRTIVSLNPIMVDGTGMCGCCRVIVGGEVKFACVDGPEFDGHLVDFDNLKKRLSAYCDFEARPDKAAETPEDHECRLNQLTSKDIRDDRTHAKK